MNGAPDPGSSEALGLHLCCRLGSCCTAVAAWNSTAWMHRILPFLLQVDIQIISRFTVTHEDMSLLSTQGNVYAMYGQRELVSLLLCPGRLSGLLWIEARG